MSVHYICSKFYLSKVNEECQNIIILLDNVWRCGVQRNEESEISKYILTLTYDLSVSSYSI